MFCIDADRIQVLHSPQEFHATLLELIKDAQQEIQLVSLYCGCDTELELQVIDALKQRNNGVRVTLIFDQLRTLRKDQVSGLPDVTADEDSSTELTNVYVPNKSSNAQLISQKLLINDGNAEMYLYRTPQLSWLLQMLLGDRMNEVVGLQHVKVYKIDQRVIISGANLSQTYFHDRQDRYYVLDLQSTGDDDVQKLNEWYNDLVTMIKSISSQYLATGELLKPSTLQPNTRSLLDRTASGADAVYSKLDSVNDKKALVVPMLQMPAHGVMQESQLISQLIAQCHPRTASVDFTSGYMNPPSTIVDALKTRLTDKQVPLNILVASSDANGFHNARGMSRYIPQLYESLFDRFVAKLPQGTFAIYQWQRAGWSYHAKGLFLNDASDRPFMTLIGSSNYNWRSEQRDLEHTSAIMSWNPALRARMQQERTNLLKNATLKTSTSGSGTGYVINLLSRILKSFL